MLAYRENNIIFRIASASAISKFKDIQAHSFIEINRRDFDFDTKSKEALLLEYDQFSQLIIKIERLMLIDDVHSLSSCVKKYILQLLVNIFDGIEEICTINKNVFAEGINNFLHVVHGYSKPLIFDSSKHALQLSGEKAFPVITQVISDYLQHTLCALHEYDTNIAKAATSPILSYTAFSHSTAHSDSVPVVHRARYFLKNNVKANFTLKNYTGLTVDTRVQQKLMQLGITLWQDEKAALTA